MASALSASLALAAPKQPATRPINVDRSGALSYTTDALGNRMPDFSFAGYRAGSEPIPTISARVVVPSIAGDSTARIQAAIDYVASLPVDSQGFRGAVLLQKGRFEITGALRINTSGVVLRGAGAGDDGTTLVATGQDRRTLVTIAGKNDRSLSGRPIAVSQKYVPVNATQFHVESAQFKVGDTVTVRRPSTAQWIQSLKMDDMGGGMGGGWKPGTRDLTWDRTITAVEGQRVTIDAPITAALDADFGGGNVASYTWPGRISNVAVENLRCESSYDTNNPKDEAHSWFAVTMDAARDAWVRRVTFKHFAGSAVSLFDGCSRVTVEDCQSLAPVSEIAGYRRHTFFTAAQQTLFQRCYSEHGRHDFAVGFCAAGPNAFVQCEAREALDDSGSIDSWAAGVLFDSVRIDGAALSLTDRRNKNAFAGWSAANSVIWQCSASQFTCNDPPGARNWGFGCWGMFAGDSLFWESDNFINPESLYYGQLAARLGKSAMDRAFIAPRDETGETRAPKPDEAAAATALATKGAPSMGDWTDVLASRSPIPTDATGVKTFDEAGLNVPQVSERALRTQRLAVTNGWITIDGHLLTGARQRIKWWRGGMRPHEVADAIKDGPDITRFAPGRIGPGLTDDLEELADNMASSGRSSLDHFYGLWYDQRDVDHERTRRPDGDAWAPFYEMPFSRSGGNELAWDGLSKYDLTKYNPWYWSRLKQFADIADQRGLVLLNQNFFQHNLLEAGAHWASHPWRSANNINQTGFPEPPPYAGDKIIYMAEQFYDVTHPVRRKLLHDYIRQCLDNFAGNSNVIQFTGDEFTGPTHFVQFWIDTIAEWERDTGKHAVIGLAAPKDVQDAILGDTARNAIVSVIDIRFWWYQPRGALFTAEGGKNLSPRQWIRYRTPKFPDFEQSVRAVKEYRQKYPDKAVLLAPEDGPNPPGWAVLMGGGSMPIVQGLDAKLLAAIPSMQPMDVPNAPEGQYLLGDAGKNYLFYCASNGAAKLNLPEGDAKYTQRVIDPRSGRMTDGPVVTNRGVVELKGPGNSPYAVWLSRQ